ncbi:MAG: hypothetical protein KY476_18030, partial [Planctomycetes bacterium]|nr:hypothetical protein [Planctomycetota bacterium]
VSQAFSAFKDESRERESNLVRINNRLQEKYADATQLSFEVPDGKIVRVDRTTGLVWIDLGEADHLPTRTTFSVYTKDHQGVGRGPEDIKGAIEVTRVFDSHQAEARVLESDIYRPIAPGDPIYSPLWEAGRPQNFAVVGLVDIDGDGQSDRDLFHQIVKSAGGQLVIEVDDQGQRNPSKDEVRIDDTVKWLIIGKIPDASTITNKVEQQAALDIGKHHSALREEAREQGVRDVTLADFLNYMGYKPRRRVWRPGDDVPFTLKAGARSTSTSETIGGSRTGSGQTSKVYGNQGRLKPPAANGSRP